MEILGGVNNALNTAFYSNVRINAAANRFFEPASVRTFYIGLRMHFNSRGGEGK
jgi:iron complex outermembrane receptor protein